MDESIWQKAFLTKELADENDKYNNTETYVAYDADNLYAAFRCKVKDTSRLSNEHLDKDNELMLSNDWVAFCVDSYHDGITAYAYIVDAAGNQLDGALNTLSRDLSFSFSSKWTYGVKKDKDAFTVEMKIPLDHLPVRWNKDSVKMAIQVIRSDKQNKRMVQWPLTKNIGKYQTILLKDINETHPQNLSGVDISDRLTYKKSKIDVSTFLGRCQGGDASVMDYLIFKKREIKGAENPSVFQYKLQNQQVKESFEKTTYFKNLNTDIDFETMLERAQTTAFIVLKMTPLFMKNTLTDLINLQLSLLFRLRNRL